MGLFALSAPARGPDAGRDLSVSFRSPIRTPVPRPGAVMQG